MADMYGRSPGQPGYDPSSETDPSQSAGSGSAFNPNTATAPAQTFSNPFAPTGGSTFTQSAPPNQAGISGVNPTNGVGGGNSTDAQLFSYLLSQNLNNPQAAIDQFNQMKPGSGLHPYYYPDTKVIGVQGQQYPYLTAPGTAPGQKDWQFGGVPGGDSNAPAGNAIDPSYLQPFGDQNVLNQNFGMKPPQFQAPGDFQMPTADSITSDPSYTFARDEAIKAATNSHAAQGLFNSGGTIYDLAKLGSGLASAQYDNIFNRDLGLWSQKWSNAINSNNASLADYQNARDSFAMNQNSPFNKLQSIAQLGYGAAANAG